MLSKTHLIWTVGQVSWPVLRLANRTPQLLQCLRYRSVCEADVWFNGREPATLTPMVAVLKNLQLRGWPAPVTQLVDDWLATGTGLVERDESKPDESGHRFKTEVIEGAARWIQMGLAHLDSRSAPSESHARESLPPYDSQAEARTGDELLPSVWGDWAKIAWRRQGELASYLDGFEGQKADFVLTAPTSVSSELPLLWCVEVDGDHHRKPEQQLLDRRRDAALTRAGGGCIRLPFGNDPDTIRQITAEYVRAQATRAGFDRLRTDNSFLRDLQENWDRPLWTKITSSRWLELAVVPIAIARVQRAIVHALECGVLSLEQEQWVIAIDERDVPCGKMAVEDLTATLTVLAQLSGRQLSLPSIQVVVRSTKEFAGSQLHFGTVATEWPDQRSVDLLIDISALQYFGQTAPLPDELHHLGNPATIVIRHADLPRTDLRGMEPLAIAEAIDWVPGSDGAQDAVEQLLRDIFRKRAFRPGQWAIISRALERGNVVGVLPTGSGKSICYQLSCLLQPCLTLVIPPLIALAADQVRGLKEAGLHRCCSISRIWGREREAVIDEVLTQHKHQFVFVMPEGLQREGFRTKLSELARRRPRPIRTVVIDEVHCVSEWGHDFRPAYLWLGRTARELLGAEALRVIGLTGTASFDVLTDAAREVGGLKEQDLIEADQFDRQELELRITAGNTYKVAGRKTHDKLPTLRSLLLDEIPRFFGMTAKEFYAPDAGKFLRAGIIFCPHAGLEADSQKNPFTVGTVAAEVRKILERAGINVPVKAYSAKHTDETKGAIQQQFMDDQIGILVSTIAFGMGIDKSNIRFVIHYAGAKSVEAYYQEIGRAGRDRAPAFCATILSDNVEAQGDTVERWLRSKDPHLPSPASRKEEKDDRDIQRFFQESNFPPVKQTKRLIWEIAKLLAEGSHGQRIEVPFAFAGRIKWQPGELNGKIDDSGKWVERELCRLSYVGLVRDYVSDYNAKAFFVERGDFSEGAVIQNVFSYVQRYKSPAQANRYRQNVIDAHARRKDNQQHLGVWAFAVGEIVNFAYNEISIKRRGALMEYMRIMRLGLRDAPAMRQEINYYFNSKYYRELQPYAKGCEIEVLWIYIAKMDGGLDELRQLYGGVVRHLTINPDNCVFRLLRAFCLLSHANFDSEEALPYLEAFKDAEVNDTLGMPDRRTIGSWITRFDLALCNLHPESGVVLARWIANYEAEWLDGFIAKHFPQ